MFAILFTRFVVEKATCSSHQAALFSLIVSGPTTRSIVLVEDVDLALHGDSSELEDDGEHTGV